jgi:hypothetical protein
MLGILIFVKYGECLLSRKRTDKEKGIGNKDQEMTRARSYWILDFLLSVIKEATKQGFEQSRK